MLAKCFSFSFSITSTLYTTTVNDLYVQRRNSALFRILIYSTHAPKVCYISLNVSLELHEIKQAITNSMHVYTS